MPARTLGPEGGWIVMSHIGWGEEQTTIYKCVETFRPEREIPKNAISASGGSGSLQYQSD